MTPIGSGFRTTPPPIGTGFYAWEPPGAGVSVHLHLAIVDRLSGQILDAARSSSGSACGLLLGRTVPESPVIVVEDSAPLPCNDPAALGKKLAQWAPGEEKRLWAVGYYCQRGNGELVLDDDVAALFTREFPCPGSVMLLTAVAKGQPVATFFVWQDGRLQRKSLLEFPLSRMALRQAVLSSPREAAPAQAEEQPRKLRRFTQLDAIRWTTITIVLLALAAIGTQDYLRFPGRARPAQPSRDADSSDSALSLSVEGTPERVMLKWNRNAPAIANGVEGTLSVTEGGSTKILMLTPAELATGSVTYMPTGTHVAFQLDVTTADRRKVTERVRFLAGGKQAGRQGGEGPR